jgi:hypothetical protein
MSFAYACHLTLLGIYCRVRAPVAQVRSPCIWHACHWVDMVRTTEHAAAHKKTEGLMLNFCRCAGSGGSRGLRVEPERRVRPR